MVQKVNKEECVARVYQFLNKHKDWKTEADKNCDNTVCKTEFRAYLLDSDFKFKDGENKKDLVDAFWESIDFKKSGSIGGGSAINNKNAIDKDESDAIERTIKATEEIIKFMKDKEAPSEITQNRTGWKNSVKEGLIYRASSFLQTHSLEELNDEWFADAYKKSSTKATADYLAAQLIKTELGGVDGYKSGDDETLSGIIDAYVATLEDDPKDEQTVIEDIKKIIAAYIDTAKTNSRTSTDLLTDYGYDPTGPLNDLQVAVLTNEITSKILDYIKQNNPDIYTDEYAEQIKDAVKAYVENYLKGKSAEEFTDLMAFNLEEFAKSTEYAVLVEKIKKEQEELKAAKAELITYIDTVLALNDEEKTKAVETVVGSTDKTTIENIVNDMKTKDAVVTMHNKLKAAIDAIDARREAEKAAKAAEEAANREKLKGLATDTTPFILDGKAHSLNSLINSSLRSVTVELSGFEDMSTAITNAMTKIDSISSTIISQLSSSYPPEALQKVFASVHNYYSAVLNGLGERGKTDGSIEYAVTYKNELTGETKIENTTVAHGWAYNHKNIDDIGNIHDESGCDPSSGIYVGYCNGWGYTIHLDLKMFAEKIISLI